MARTVTPLPKTLKKLKTFTKQDFSISQLTWMPELKNETQSSGLISKMTAVDQSSFRIRLIFLCNFYIIPSPPYIPSPSLLSTSKTVRLIQKYYALPVIALWVSLFPYFENSLPQLHCYIDVVIHPFYFQSPRLSHTLAPPSHCSSSLQHTYLHLYSVISHHTIEENMLNCNSSNLVLSNLHYLKP